MPVALLHCRQKRISAAIALTLLTVLSSSAAQAATFIATRSALESNDQLDWSSLGRVFNPLNPDLSAFLPETFSATTQKGLDLTVDIPFRPDLGVTPPFVFQTLPPPAGIPTNFASGDFLLFTGLNLASGFPAVGNPGPLTLTFEEPVFAAGAQFSVDDTPSFDATISAFDEMGDLIDTFTIPGMASIDLDNSAVFLGIQSDSANIARIDFSSSEPERAFAINTLSIETSVPEPAMVFGLLAAGAMVIGSYQAHNT